MRASGGPRHVPDVPFGAPITGAQNATSKPSKARSYRRVWRLCATQR